MYSRVAVHHRYKNYNKFEYIIFYNFLPRSEMMAENAQSNGQADPVTNLAAKVTEIALEAKPEPSKPEAEQAVEAKPVNVAKFKEQFKAFSKFGDTKSDGKHITLSQSDKWMKQAKVN